MTIRIPLLRKLKEQLSSEELNSLQGAIISKSICPEALYTDDTLLSAELIAKIRAIKDA
jgi:hypothetical protein